MNELKDLLPARKTIVPVLLFTAAMAFILSCSVFGSPEPTATPQPTATNTMAPTNTQRPTETSKPEPTKKPTVNKAATNAAKEEQTAAALTQFAGAVLGEIESKLDAVGENMGYGHVEWLYPDPVEIESSKANIVTHVEVKGAEVDNFAFHSMIKWETLQKIGIVYCVVEFRIVGNQDSDGWYMMRMGRISGLGHIFFDVMRGWSIIGENNGDASGYINTDNGAENEVILVVNKNRFDVYVNGKHVSVWFNTQYDRGGFGLGTLQDTGTSVCTFSDNWIWNWDS